MLNFHDRPFVYFPPKPNKIILTLGMLYNRLVYLPGKVHLIDSVQCDGCGEIRRLAADKKNRLLFLANHPSHSDSQIILESFRQIGIASNFMATYDLFFRQSKFNRWVMQKAGTFSVDRESFNSEPIKEAINILRKGKYHLTIFAEGRPYLQNDLLSHFHDGGSFIAWSAQKTLNKDGRGEKVFIVPTAIKLTHSTDCREKILEMLLELYSFLGIKPGTDPDLEISDLISSAAVALMNHGLTEMGYPTAKGKTIEEKQNHAAEMIVSDLEIELHISPEKGKTLRERIREVRNSIHKVMLNRNGNSREWAQFRIYAQKIMLAMKIESYPQDYVAGNPTLDRCGETVERLIEDRQSKAIPPYCPRKGIVKFGRPFTLHDIDPEEILKKNEVLTELTTRTKDSIQDLIGQINSNNSYPGGELF